MSTMDFNELVSGATVRFTMMDGVQYLSIKDLIMIVCDKNEKRASETWSRLSQDSKSELSAFCGNFRFPGKHQQIQPVITFDGALTLMNWLPGENAKKWRGKTAKILKRYLAGDSSLIDDLVANASSDSPLHQAARAAMNNPEPAPGQDQLPAQESPAEIEYNLLKRRRLDEVTYLRESTPLYRSKIEVQDLYCRKSQEWHEVYMKIENDKIDLEMKRINMERAKFNLLGESCRQDLEYKRGLIECTRREIENKRALKALDSADPVPTAPTAPTATPTAVPTAIPDPADTTTVLKVFRQNRDAFPLLKPDQRKSFLVKAGTYAANAYALQYGIQPSKIDENGHDVNAYPVQADPLIFQSLRASYRDFTAGASQTTLDAGFFRPIHCSPLM